MGSFLASVSRICLTSPCPKAAPPAQHSLTHDALGCYFSTDAEEREPPPQSPSPLPAPPTCSFEGLPPRCCYSLAQPGSAAGAGVAHESQGKPHEICAKNQPERSPTSFWQFCQDRWASGGGCLIYGSCSPHMAKRSFCDF